MVIIKEVVKSKFKILTRPFLLLERVNVKITLKQGTTQNRSGKPSEMLGSIHETQDDTETWRHRKQQLSV